MLKNWLKSGTQHRNFGNFPSRYHYPLMSVPRNQHGPRYLCKTASMQATLKLDTKFNTQNHNSTYGLDFLHLTLKFKRNLALESILCKFDNE